MATQQSDLRERKSAREGKAPKKMGGGGELCVICNMCAQISSVHVFCRFVERRQKYIFMACLIKFRMQS